MNAINIITVMVVLLLVGCNKEEVVSLQSANKELESANKELESANKELESANTALKGEVSKLKTTIEKDLVAKAEYDVRLEELKAESAKANAATTSLVAAQEEIEKLRKEKEKLIADVANAKTKAAEAQLAALKAKVESEKLPPAFQNQLLALMKKGNRLVNSTERPSFVRKGSANQECNEATTEFSASLETTLALWPEGFEPQAKVKFESFEKAYSGWEFLSDTFFRIAELNIQLGRSRPNLTKEITDANALFREARTQVLSKLK